MEIRALWEDNQPSGVCLVKLAGESDFQLAVFEDGKMRQVAGHVEGHLFKFKDIKLGQFIETSQKQLIGIQRFISQQSKQLEEEYNKIAAVFMRNR